MFQEENVTTGRSITESLLGNTHNVKQTRIIV
jgi:hypothetical protein